MVRAVDHAWAAGLCDADSCITIRRTRQGGGVYYALKVVVGQSGMEPPDNLLRLAALYGGSVTRGGKTRPGKLPTWQWSRVCRQAEDFLRKVVKHMTGKRAQAELALEYRERGLGVGRREAAESYYRRLSEFKHYRRRG